MSHVLRFVLLVLFFVNAHAEVVIRDSEVEDLIYTMIAPILDVAEVDNADQLKVLVINSPEINAYVVGSGLIVVNYGLLTYSDKPDVLMGVMAHEIAHIAFRHSSRIREKILDSKLVAGLGTLVGIVGVASGNVNIGSAIAMLANSAANQSLLFYSREQEKIADYAALSYLDQCGYRSSGLRRILNHFKLTNGETQVYFRTHPLSQDRINNLNSHVTVNEGGKKNLYEEEFRRIFVKMKSFIEDPDTILKLYNAGGDEDHYARAIAMYRKGMVQESLLEVDILLKKHENDPYYNEMKADILLQANQAKESLPFYKKALSRKMHSSLIKVSYAKAMINVGSVDSNNKAILDLKSIIDVEPSNNFARYELARGYENIGDMVNSYITLLNLALENNRIEDAKKYLFLAKKYLNSSNNDVEKLYLEDVEQKIANIKQGEL